MQGIQKRPPMNTKRSNIPLRLEFGNTKIIIIALCSEISEEFKRRINLNSLSAADEQALKDDLKIFAERLDF